VACPPSLFQAAGTFSQLTGKHERIVMGDEDKKLCQEHSFLLQIKGGRELPERTKSNCEMEYFRNRDGGAFLRSPLPKAIGAKSCSNLTRVCNRKTSAKAEIFII